MSLGFFIGLAFVWAGGMLCGIPIGAYWAIRDARRLRREGKTP